MAENAKAFAKYGARFLARGGNSEVVEGRSYSRTGTVEFKYFDTALTATTHLNMRGLIPTGVMIDRRGPSL